MTVDELRDYHTNRGAMAVTVTCDKSPVPMLWLDSSILMDLAKRGEIEKARAKTLAKLREVVRKAVREERLICPEWEQVREYEGRRLNAEIQEIAAGFSYGARCASSGRVQDQLVLRGLVAYIRGASSIHIPASDFFYDDPSQHVREALSSAYIVYVATERNAEWVAKRDKSRLSLAAELEKARVGQTIDRVRFDEQLAVEQRAVSRVMSEAVIEYRVKAQFGLFDAKAFEAAQTYLMHLSMWRDLGGPGDELAGLFSFMNSPYYWELPTEDISCRLFADVLVNQAKVKSGDSNDISHLAMAIPVAHYVVTDKAMADRCRRRGIGTKWNTKIVSSKGLEKLCDELEGLPGITPEPPTDCPRTTAK